MTWYLHNTAQEFTEDMIGGAFGMVYIITHTPTGKKYVGKKFFTKAKTRQVKGKKKRSRVASDWLTYWGSNKELQEEVKKNGEEQYTREILHLCKSRSECAYWETWEIFTRGALRTDDYYNDWCSCRIRKAHLLSNRTPAMYKTKMRRSTHFR
jgi:hypothetical protein